MIKQNVMTVEFKQIFGMVFNDKGPLPIEEEVAIFHRVEKEIQ